LSRSAASMQKSLSLISAASIVNLGQQAFHAGQRIYGLARNVASSLNDIDRMSKIAGISSDAFQKMSYAAKMTDVEADVLAIGLKKLSSGMDETSRGMGQAASWFNAMGISVKDSAGNLKPLDVIMGQIAQKFSQWEDGPRKIAIAVDLFGRSGQNLIPYLNQGAAGLKKFYEEAERLGVVLDESLIQKGTLLEDKFKRVEAQASAMWKRIVVGAYEAIDAIATFELKAFGRAWGPFMGMRKLPAEEIWAKETRFKLPVSPKTQPPGAAGKAIDASKEALAAWDAEVARANELGEVFLARQELTEISFWNQRKVLENLAKIEGERAEQLANDMFPSMEIVASIQDKMTSGAEELRVKLFEMRELVINFGWEDYASGVRDASNEATRALSRMEIAAQKVTESGKFWENLAQNISSAWSSNLVNIIRGTESMSEKVKGFFQSIGDVFLSTVSKMITQWLIFGSITGEKKEGGGWGGVLGWVTSLLRLSEGGVLPGSFTPIRQFAGGGVANRPTLGLIGEGGDSEAVVPLKSGSIPVEMSGENRGRGGTTIVVLPHNYDKSFSEMIQRNPSAFIAEILKNARQGGTMKDIVRSMK